MEKLERPTGLIRFASEAEFAGEKARRLRPRLAGYGAVIVAAIGGVLWGFTGTTELLVEIRRDRSSLFTRLDEHTVCNHYRIKVEGFADRQSLIHISVQGPGPFELFGAQPIDLGENNSIWLPYRVCGIDIEQPRNKLQFVFEGDGIEAGKETTFLTNGR